MTVLYLAFTFLLYIAATHFLGLELYASGTSGDCACGCDPEPDCNYACKYKGGCIHFMFVSGKCDSSGTACNSTYNMYCANLTKPIQYVCGEECPECDRVAWQ